MADNIRRIVAEFSAKNKAKGIMGGFRRDMDVTGRALRRLAVGALAVAGVGGFGYMIKRQMETIDATAKLSDRLGLATEKLIGLQHAASITGTDAETLNKSLEIFTRRLGEMTQGSGEAKRGLDMLGLTAEQLIYTNPAEAFGIAADKIKQLGTQAEKTAAAYFLFGRAGSKMLNMLEVGSEGLKDFQKEVEKLGLTFSRIDAAKVEAANDALTRARATMTGLFRQATIELAPYIEALANKFVDVATAGEGLGVNVVNIFESMSIAAIRFGSLIQTIPAYWKGVEAAARDSLAVIYDLADAATNLDVLFKKLKRPGWEKTYKELAEEQRQIAADLIEEGGRKLAGIYGQENAVRRYFDDLRKKREMQRPDFMTTFPDVMKFEREPFSWEKAAAKQTKAVISAERKRMQALENTVNEEINLLGRLDEPRQHARMLIQYQAAAMEEFTGDAQKAAAAIDVFRGKLKELEKAQKWAEVARTMEQSFAGALERLSQDWRNYGEVAKGVLREILMESMRIMMFRPAGQALAGVLSAGIGALFGGTPAGIPTTATRPSTVGPTLMPSAQHGGEVLKTGLAVIHRGETYSGPGVGMQMPSVNIEIYNESGVPLQQKDDPVWQEDKMILHIEAKLNDRIQRNAGPLRNTVENLK